MSTRDLSKMTVVQLREQLRSRGLPTDGTKAGLIERLKGSYAAEDTILNSDASASKDSLEEAVLEGAINEDDILGPDTSIKKKDDLSVTKASTPAILTIADQAAAVNGKSQAVINSLERAQRFGLPLSDEQLKQKRSERFGMQSSSSAQIDEILAEKKRRRAERFGVVSETEKMKEILDRRAKRFGIDNKSNVLTAGKVEKAPFEILERRRKRFGLWSEEAELEMKKQRRAERFGLKKN